MLCQRCGKRNEGDAENCRFCKAPLYVVRPERPARPPRTKGLRP